MIRGIRGATTVIKNIESEILQNTKQLIEEMVTLNQVHPTSISHVLISVTPDLNATFPAKALRLLEGWTFVPVMCMTEINVPTGLPKCIRIMMVANTDISQDKVQHVFHNDAIYLRPDLQKEVEESQ
ncbi:chorismate mutase [Virgibacillus sp. LDC-1]|uniref:chorismate mutase n=1 Tax=Virgibacillus sp. LDC-1 TaxID=3039856 RepID=UPI0024DEE975|nr:chorismate mutase [Virgibacillus sp. LDC-1]